MARPTVAEIDLSAIAGNCRALLRECREGVRCIGVVKADAYGHGAVPVAQALAREGVAIYAVALAEEAVELSDAGVPGRIVIMGCPTADDAGEIVARGFEPVISSVSQAAEFAAVARTAGRRVAVHLKFDTGMGRVGIDMRRAIETAREINGFASLHIVGAMTHFPSADDPDARDFTLGQIAAFRTRSLTSTRSGRACRFTGVIPRVEWRVMPFCGRR